jgi:hypothetical protein
MVTEDQAYKKYTEWCKVEKKDGHFTDLIVEYLAVVMTQLEAAQQSVQRTGRWACSCGYAMPEPLQSCVKCGAPRR